MTADSGEIGRNPDQTQIFLDAYGAVEQYNQQHVGPTGITSQVIWELYQSQKSDYEPPAVTPQEEAEFDQKRVIEAHEASLAGLGIKLDVQPPDAMYDAMFGYQITADPALVPHLLVPKISEAGQFGLAIDGLDPTDEQKEATRTGINKILDNTLKDVKDTYRGLRDEDDTLEAIERHGQAEAQMDALIDLNPVLVASGYGNEAFREELATCMTRYRDDTLAEYIAAKDLDLLDPKKSPAGWLLYMQAPHLEYHWDQVLKLLKGLRDKEGESEFYPELFANVKAAFVESIDMLADKDAGHWAIGGAPQDRIQPLQAVMDAVEERLNQDFMLENLFHLDGQNSEELDD